MTPVPNPTFLRRVLTLDAAASAATGALMAIGAPWLAAPLGLPAELLVPAGLSLFPFAAYVGYLASRTQVAPNMVWAVVAINVLWVAQSFGLLASGWYAPTALGTAFVAAQALAVGGLGAGEAYGLRQATQARRAT